MSGEWSQDAKPDNQVRNPHLADNNEALMLGNYGDRVPIFQRSQKTQSFVSSFH